MPHTPIHISNELVSNELEDILSGINLEEEFEKITVESEAKEAELKLIEQRKIKAEKEEEERIKNLESSDTLLVEEDGNGSDEQENMASNSQFMTKVKQMPENAKNLFKEIISFPSLIKKTYTGEDVEIEFPEIPEMGNMGGDAPSFLEGLIPSVATTAVRDKFGKAEVLRDAWKGDERWGGAFVDKFGHPMIMWKDKPYYVNKPGATETDFSQAVGEIIKYMPLGKFVQAGNFLQRTAKGILGYGAVETAQKGTESFLTPEVTKAKAQTTLENIKEIGTMTGVAVAVDAFVPPAFKGIALAFKRAGKTLPSPETLLKLFPELNISLEDLRTIYPTTTAQRDAKITTQASGKGLIGSATDDLKAEDVLRNSSLPGGAIIREFDERQLALIRADAIELQKEFGSGAYGSGSPSGVKYTTDDLTGDIVEQIVPPQSVSGIKNIVTGRSEALKTEASNIFQKISQSENPPVFNEYGVLSSSRNILDYLEDQLGPDTIQRFTLAKGWMDKFNKLIKDTSKSKLFEKTPDVRVREANIKNAGNKKFSLRDANDRLIAINDDITTSMKDGRATQETRILMGIKKRYEDFLYGGIEKGFASGDQELLKQLKSAKDIYFKYLKLSGKGTSKGSSEKAANSVLKDLTEEGLTAESVVNKLIMNNALMFPKTMKLTLKRFKENLPKEEYVEVIGLLKDTILQKAFSGAGKSGVTRSNIVNNYNKIFLGNKGIIDEIFTPAEIQIISNFRKNVAPTIWADPSMKLNASNSAYTMFSAMNMYGLLSLTRGIPIVSQAVGIASRIVPGAKAIEEGASVTEAMRAIRQYSVRSSEPLLKFKSPSILGKTFETGIGTPSDLSAVGRETSRPFVNTDDEKKAISSIFEEIDSQTRRKILDAANIQ